MGFGMLSSSEVQKIHQELSRIYRDNLVLLGGSYANNTAGEDSDLDIFLICNLKFFLNRKKFKALSQNLKKQYPKLQIMLVPKIFFKYGWYKVQGRDINGREFSSPINKKIIFRNACKLAYFYLLKSSAGDKKEYWKKQSDKQAALAKETQSGEKIEKLMSFSLVNYLIYNLKFIPIGNFEFLFCNPDKKIINLLKKSAKENDLSKLAYFERVVFPVIIW